MVVLGAPFWVYQAGGVLEPQCLQNHWNRRLRHRQYFMSAYNATWPKREGPRVWYTFWRCPTFPSHAQRSPGVGPFEFRWPPVLPSCWTSRWFCWPWLKPGLFHSSSSMGSAAWASYAWRLGCRGGAFLTGGVRQGGPELSFFFFFSVELPRESGNVQKFQKLLAIASISSISEKCFGLSCWWASLCFEQSPSTLWFTGHSSAYLWFRGSMMTGRFRCAFCACYDFYGWFGWWDLDIVQGALSPWAGSLGFSQPKPLLHVGLVQKSGPDSKLFPLF